jgi:hypothetical protein
MAFELLSRSRGDDQIRNLRREEAPQPTHPLDLADLVGDALFQLLIEPKELAFPRRPAMKRSASTRSGISYSAIKCRITIGVSPS